MRTIRSRTAAACLIVAAIQIHGVASLRKHDVHRHSRTDVYRRKQQHSISATINNVRGGGLHNAIDAASTPTPSTNASKGTLQAMRLLYLTYYASMGALMPYLPVYFHSLGHKGTSIGLLGAVKPLTTLLAAPLWGIISDKSGNHVSTLQFTFVTSLVCQLLVAMNSNLTYLIVTVFITALLNAPVKSLIDSIVMSKLTSEEDKYQFGRMRLWGQLGFGAGSSLVGSLLSLYPADATSKPTSPSTSAPVPSDTPIGKVIETGIEIASESNAETTAICTAKACNTLVEFTRDILGKTRPLKGYEWAFLAHAVLSIPTYFCIRAFRPAKSDAVIDQKKQKQKSVEEKKETNIMDGLRLVSKNSDALVFFFLVFVIGTSSGCIENFAYVRVREVGGTGNNMGILRLVSSLAGAPMFWFSGPLTEALGNDVVLVLSLLAYVTRFLNYAWMKHPYHALPAEALRGITFAMFWSSGSMYAHKISPPGMKATMLLTMNAMYGGLGQSLGAIIGGKLQTNFGTAKTFIYSGIFDFCFVGALVMYLLTRSDRAFT
eukprot:scaffold1595_cov102-Skeletonema_dohrnii-CCMP3373.AAC.2